MLADIRRYDRCQTGARRGEHYSPPYYRHRFDYDDDEGHARRWHRCQEPSELRDAIERKGSYYQTPLQVARELHAQAIAPEPWTAYTHCRACTRRLWRQVHWPPDLWADLNARAAREASKTRRPAPLPKPFRPTRNHPRDEKPGKAYARLEGAILKLGKDEDRAHALIGKDCGNGMVLAATDGHVALIVPGQEKREENGNGRTIDLSQRSDEAIDLPEDFQLACKRVALLANDRSPAIHFTVDRVDGQVRLTLRAQSCEYGEASEWLPITSHTLAGEASGSDRPLLAAAEDFEPFTCCLGAEYLDLFCGVWPLRWYLRRPVTTTRPHAWDQSKLETVTNDQYQAFQPAGCDWRLVLMPMRI